MLRKKILSHATTWMNLKAITLSEVSQIQIRQKHYNSLYEESKIAKFMETECRMVYRGWGQRQKRSHLMAVEFQICRKKRIHNLFHNHVNIFNTTELTVHLKTIKMVNFIFSTTKKIKKKRK